MQYKVQYSIGVYFVILCHENTHEFKYRGLILFLDILQKRYTCKRRDKMLVLNLKIYIYFTCIADAITHFN